MWIVKETGNKKVLWSAVQGGLTHYKKATWHLRIFLYVSTGKRIELPGNVALWFLHWSGCICATCWWHDWSISSCSALALLITLLNIATGEALLEAAVTLPEQWCTLAPPFNPFFPTLAHLNGPPVKPFSENMHRDSWVARAALRTLVNGLRAVAYWGPWTRWPKKSETKMSFGRTCRSALDKGRHRPVKPIWLLSWKGDTYCHESALSAGLGHPHLHAGLRQPARPWPWPLCPHMW